MKPYDILAIGELNVDLILNRIDGQPEVGKEKFAEYMILTLGSSTAIFAANAAALGAKVGFVGMIGHDSFGDLIRESLRAKGVDTSMLIESDTLSSGATIILNYGEDRAMVTYQGAMATMSFADIDKSVFEQTRHIHISSIFLQPALNADLEKVLAYARSRGVTTSLDAQWDPAEKWEFDYARILPLVSVFLPNEKELMLLTSSATVDEAIEKIKPYVNTAVIKMGNKGSLLVCKEGEAVFLPSFLNREVVDAIGAGDSFNAGCISRFVKGEPLSECQRFGNLMGAINTTAAGGTGAFTDKAKIEAIARNKFNQFITL